MNRRYQDGRATSFHDRPAARRPRSRFREVQAKQARILVSAGLQIREGLARTETPDLDDVPIPLLQARLTKATPATRARGRTAKDALLLARRCAWLCSASDRRQVTFDARRMHER